MKPEEINIAIAELMGWKVKQFPNGPGVKWVGPNGEGCNGGGLDGWGYNDEADSSHLPDYYNDLNAIHEVVYQLGYEDYQMFCLNLGTIIRRDWSKTWIVPAERGAINATAPQRCEALLKTLGKWKE